MGSELAAEYVGKTIGKETMGALINGVPVAGDVVGLATDIAMEYEEQQKKGLLIRMIYFKQR